MPVFLYVSFLFCLFVYLLYCFSPTKASMVEWKARLSVHGGAMRITDTNCVLLATRPGALPFRVSTRIVGPVFVHCDLVR